jgi:hypothetical protein
MPRRSILPRLALAASLAAPASLTVLPGCTNEADLPAARTAEQAVGVQPGRETGTAEKSTHDVTVVKETKVIDNTSGKVISETKESTPVTITERKRVTNDVKVDVGKTDASATNK